MRTLCAWAAATENQLDWRLETLASYICSPLVTMITSLGPILVLAISTTVLAGDINRQSIIFNENTPDVFYCPQVRKEQICVFSSPVPKPKSPRPSPNPVKSSQNQFQRDWG